MKIRLGAAWFDLPVDDEVSAASLESRVDARIEREPGLADRRDALIDMLAYFARDARQRGAIGAALYWKRHELDIVAVATLYATLSPRPSGGPVRDEIDRLQSHLGERYATDTIEPSVEVRDLPVGPALRVQVVSGPKLDDDGRGAALLETVQYWIPVSDRPASLLLNFSTPNLAGAEPLVGEFDQIARHLELRA